MGRYLLVVHCIPDTQLRCLCLPQHITVCISHDEVDVSPVTWPFLYVVVMTCDTGSIEAHDAAFSTADNMILHNICIPDTLQPRHFMHSALREGSVKAVRT